MTRVKVCGITSVTDAVLSAEAGADALGFIFAPVSRRLVSPGVARQAGLSVGPGPARVGVFMNQALDEVLRDATGLPVVVAEEALSCVALGTGRALEEMKRLRQVLSSMY